MHHLREVAQEVRAQNCVGVDLRDVLLRPQLIMQRDCRLIDVLIDHEPRTAHGDVRIELPSKGHSTRIESMPEVQEVGRTLCESDLLETYSVFRLGGEDIELPHLLEDGEDACKALMIQELGFQHRSEVCAFSCETACSRCEVEVVEKLVFA